MWLIGYQSTVYMTKEIENIRYINYCLRSTFSVYTFTERLAATYERWEDLPQGDSPSTESRITKGKLHLGSGLPFYLAVLDTLVEKDSKPQVFSLAIFWNFISVFRDLHVGFYSQELGNKGLTTLSLRSSETWPLLDSCVGFPTQISANLTRFSTGCGESPGKMH